jgi:hypothetical protein
MNWINGATLLSKFEHLLYGSYQDEWREILAASGPNDDLNNTTTRPTPCTNHSPERDVHVNKRSHESAQNPRQSRSHHPRQSTTQTNTRRSTHHHCNNRDTKDSQFERYDSYFMDFVPLNSREPAISVDTNSDINKSFDKPIVRKQSDVGLVRKLSTELLCANPPNELQQHTS